MADEKRLWHKRHYESRGAIYDAQPSLVFTIDGEYDDEFAPMRDEHLAACLAAMSEERREALLKPFEVAEIGGFGVDPKDSAALLELRQAIDDRLGWETTEEEEAADYPARIRQIAARYVESQQAAESAELRATQAEARERAANAGADEAHAAMLRADKELSAAKGRIEELERGHHSSETIKLATGLRKELDSMARNGENVSTIALGMARSLEALLSTEET